MNWFKRKSYPEFWKHYIDHFNYGQKSDIASVRFVVFDTETTGLDPKNDRILSIGCVAVEGLRIKVADQLELYVVQDAFNADTVKIHGLLKEGKLAKISEEEAVKQFLHYTKNAVLVAHHAAFDVAMINQALKRLELPRLRNKVIDTGHLFQKTKLDTNKMHFSLDELSDRYNIPAHDRHTASGDAYITALLFLKLATTLHAKNLADLASPRKRIGLL